MKAECSCSLPKGPDLVRHSGWEPSVDSRSMGHRGGSSRTAPEFGRVCAIRGALGMACMVANIGLAFTFAMFELREAVPKIPIHEESFERLFMKESGLQK